MSQPAASAEPTWTPRRLRVPREDRQWLIVPPLEQALVAARQNRARLETNGAILQGRPLDVLRRWSREACLRAAAQYTASLIGEDVAVDAESPLIFIAGHQPSLYHPGVWAKNFGIDRLAADSGGTGLNLLVDNDTLGSTNLSVPAGTRNEPRLAQIPFAAARAVQPWEDSHITDRRIFESFADRVAKPMSAWGITPILSEIWPDTVAHQSISSRLCDCLTAARQRLERRWGLGNLELPISRMCQTDPFLWFASHLLAQLPKFRACHNRVLDEYRRLNRVRSRNHPVPRLVERDGWHEAPFWVWREGDPRRHGVLAKQTGREVHLSDGRATFARLPLSPEMDACCAVEVLKELMGQGLRFRTRALTTTLFARLCLGDLFVHGIGGAKYDEMTDQIIREFYGLEPPAFSTMSATLQLPIAEPFDVSETDRRRLERRLRDLQFNADRQELGAEAEPLIARKESLIAEGQTASTTGLSRRERNARRPENRRRHRRLTEVNSQLAALAAGQREETRQELHHVNQQLAANRVLQSREFSFALYPAQMLREFLSSL